MSALDKAKNKAEELVGKGKEKVGDATGDDQLKAEGNVDQTKGNLKQAGEKVKDAFKD
ncbi:MAG: CsbD family protein [Jatrophihabitans sp.]